MFENPYLYKEVRVSNNLLMFLENMSVIFITGIRLFSMFTVGFTMYRLTI